jgi:DNA (cytosine-5)-methyltransferase 1
MMSKSLVLSLFPGIGLLDMAFEQEGFCVVRGPDVLWGGDVRRFHPLAGRFDGVIGGPPCQCFSRLAHLVRHNGYEPKFGNLIPEFERCVFEARPRWFLMENVPDAPPAVVPGYVADVFRLNNRKCLDDSGVPAKQNRLRQWTWGMAERPIIHLRIETADHENPEFEYAAVGGSGGGSRSSSGTCKKATTTLPFNVKSRRAFEMIRDRQCLPKEFDLPPFTVVAKCKAVGNGVPLPMGRAIAKAVRLATEVEK